jgi:hypothetical protein
MLLKLSENLEKTLPLRRTYKGKVVDNEDPETLGRVKCEVSGIFEGDSDDLPWIFPRRSGGLGGKANSGWYAVPEIDSYLEIVFPTQDVYSPFYIGYWEDAKTTQDTFKDDYPDTYGFEDSTGTKLIINKAQESFKFEHVSGIKMEMDSDGNFSLTIPSDVTEVINGDKNVTATNITNTTDEEFGVSAGGDAKVEAGGMGSFKGTGGTEVGDSGSATDVQGSVVNLAGGGVPIARLGDQAVGTGNAGAPVVSNIVKGSPKVTSG